MTTIYGNIGQASYKSRGSRSWGFIPTGRVRRIGEGPNRATRANMAEPVRGEHQLQAKIIVGFNVGSKQRWHMRDLENTVLRIRKAQGLTAGATFLSQRGIYQTRVGGPLVRENGGQVILLNIWDGLAPRAFVDRVRSLAVGLVKKLHQDSVIVEVTRGGRVVKQWVETQ